MTWKLRTGLLSAVLGMLLNANVASAQPIELKLAYFVGDQHSMSQWLIKWANNLEKDSGGRIVIKRFPGSQMGPMQQHYDLARTGANTAETILTPGNVN